MKIDNEIAVQNITSIEKQNTVQEKILPQEAGKAITSRTNTNTLDKLTVSTEGQLFQENDAISNQIDSILERHLTPEQKKEINKQYSQLDEIFKKDSLSKKEESLVESLFEKVHETLETSAEKLSGEEHATIDRLVKKMDFLTNKLENNTENSIEKGKSGDSRKNKSDDLLFAVESQSATGKKRLTVSELNQLSVAELNKLPINQLKKLNIKQLNRLNATQLNKLPVSQLQQLTPSNIDKLNEAQMSKLSSTH